MIKLNGTRTACYNINNFLPAIYVRHIWLLNLIEILILFLDII
jgi:hypothetical protein